MSSAIEPYTLLRAALALFEKPPAELLPEELSRSETQARNEFTLETRVLNSPEAAAVIVPDKELDFAFAEIRKRFESGEEFEAVLTANGLTVETLKTALVRECKVNAVLERVAAHAPVINDVEIGLYYHSHPEKFYCPEQRTSRHILISINPDFPENTRETALQRIEEIAEKLKRKPHKFEALALKNSECPTAFNGGELGAVIAGKLFPELDAVLFALKEKEISGVVETEVGFHLIQCLKISHAETMSLKKATPKIRAVMQERQRQIYQREWLASLPKVSESHDQRN
jgi:peptidylprolyl isomerase/peptidyl-prolyl cis-trans isomerase C